MKDFPDFMKNPANRISTKSHYTRGVEGYVFDGRDGSQMTIWVSRENTKSEEHVHDFDEYFVVVQGKYTLILEGKRIELGVGDEFYIPAGTVHGGETIAGTRTVDAFGGKRARRDSDID